MPAPALAGLIWKFVERPGDLLMVRMPDPQSDLIEYWTARSHRHVRRQMVPTDGQQTPASFA